MKIGELARKAGVSVETVRFYEREGLLQPPQRRESGYRDYPLESLGPLRFIRHAKEFGFTLPEIQELLALRSSAEAPCSDVKRRIESKIADVRRRILSLEQLESMLANLAASCAAVEGSSDCPVLNVLDRSDEEIKEGRHDSTRANAPRDS
jgi:MerR family mercuric resistance operon transcriptional regulator